MPRSLSGSFLSSEGLQTLCKRLRQLCSDIGKGFQVDKILDLMFLVYICKFRAEKLIGLLGFFKQCFSSSSETVFFDTLSKLEVSIIRYYIVHAIRLGRKDKVIEFFGISGCDLLQRDQEWNSWFAVPYLKNPCLDPQFRVYFSQEWFDALSNALNLTYLIEHAKN